MTEEEKSVQNSYEELPSNLPVPIDDGACDHFVGMRFPDIFLKSTTGENVNLSRIEGGVVIYCYPMTGKPGVPLPEGWDEIPGARGCTPQSCSFRDHHAELSELGAEVFGMSTQTYEYQQEMAERLHLSFQVISDSNLEFCRAMKIPTFSVDGNTLMKRVTMISYSGSIEAVHYPVFPSDSDPKWVIQYLSNRT